ncbi:hypothetical protein C8R47DRAFT_1083205 [Mycena vitilis]|nr:hypothetical protein C8R47DRAFT_1083205 [Mycena vitilis]
MTLTKGYRIGAVKVLLVNLKLFVLLVRTAPAMNTGRDVFLPENGPDVELWSPNSTQLPFFAGLKDPSFTVGMPEDIRDRYYDGHLGRFDPTVSPQYLDSNYPWNPFLRRRSKVSEKDPAYPAYQQLADVWKSSDSRLGHILSDYVNRLETLARSLHRVITHLSFDHNSLLWKNRPQYPSLAQIRALEGVSRWEEAVDLGTCLQRGVREMEAFISYVQKYRKLDLHQMRCTAVAPADEQYIGLWINGAGESDALQYLSASIPCFVIHTYAPDETHRSTAGLGKVFSDFITGTELEGPCALNLYEGLASLHDTLSSPAFDFHIGQRVHGSPEQEAWSASPYIPTMRIGSSPPPVTVPKQRGWKKYRLEEINGNLVFLYHPKLQSSRTKWYDRDNNRVLFCPSNLQLPPGVVSDVGSFGAPAPRVPFMLRSNAPGAGEILAPQPGSNWMYSSEQPKRADIGRVAPQPAPRDLPKRDSHALSSPNFNTDADADEDEDEDTSSICDMDVDTVYIPVPASNVVLVRNIFETLTAGQIAAQLSDGLWSLRITLLGIARLADVWLEFDSAENGMKAHGLLCAQNSLGLGLDLSVEYRSPSDYVQVRNSSADVWTPPVATDHNGPNLSSHSPHGPYCTNVDDSPSDDRVLPVGPTWDPETTHADADEDEDEDTSSICDMDVDTVSIPVPASNVVLVRNIPETLTAGQIAAQLSDGLWSLRITLLGIARLADVWLEFDSAENGMKAHGLLCAQNSLGLGLDLSVEYRSPSDYVQVRNSSADVWTPPVATDHNGPNLSSHSPHGPYCTNVDDSPSDDRVLPVGPTWDPETTHSTINLLPCSPRSLSSPLHESRTEMHVPADCGKPVTGPDLVDSPYAASSSTADLPCPQAFEVVPDAANQHHLDPALPFSEPQSQRSSAEKAEQIEKTKLPGHIPQSLSQIQPDSCSEEAGIQISYPASSPPTPDTYRPGSSGSITLRKKTKRGSKAGKMIADKKRKLAEHKESKEQARLAALNPK